MNLNDAVSAAAAALIRGEDANWELARLTYEHTKDSRSHAPEPDKMTMAEWCRAVRAESGRKFSERTGGTYRRVWVDHLHVPADDRPSWTEASYSATGDSTDKIRERHQSNPDLWAPERKREAFAKLAADPEVVEHDEAIEVIERSPQIQRRLNERHNERVTESVRRTERIADVDPIGQSIDSKVALLDLERACRQFADAVAYALPNCKDVPAGDVFLSQSVERAVAAAEAVRYFLENGKTDIDAFLEAVLNPEG